MADAPPNASSVTRTPNAAALAAPPQPPHAVRQIVLRATADTWVRVQQQNGGRVLLSRNLKAGEIWPVPAEPGLILDTGNAAGLDLEVDSVPMRLTGGLGGVVHNVPLDSDLVGTRAAVRLGH